MFDYFIKLIRKFLFVDYDVSEKNDEKENTEVTSTYEVPLNKSIQSLESATLIKSIDPRSYYECTTQVNDFLKRNNAVIINLHKLDKNTVSKAIAYLCGAVYALDGTIEKIGDNVILVAPRSIPVSGGIEEDATGGKDADTQGK